MIYKIYQTNRLFSIHSRGQHLCKFIGTKESVCIRKEFNSQRVGLGHQYGLCDVCIQIFCNKDDELDELYDKVHEVKEDLAAMRHKRSLMKMYLKKLKETDENITLVILFL